MDVAVGLAVAHMRQERRRMTLHPNQCPLGDRLLDGIENVANFILWLGGPDQQMSMFRHNHVGPNVEWVGLTSPVDGINEPLPASIPAQKRQTLIARECQRVRITDSVVPFAGFSVAHDNSSGRGLCPCPRKAVGMPPE